MREIITHINKGPDSPARVLPPERKPLRVVAIQEPWHGSVERQKIEISAAIEAASEFSPDLIVLTELTLYPYACTRPNAQADFVPELLAENGMSVLFASEIARASGAHVVISLYEDAGDSKYNTALTVAPGGEILLKTRKTHIPITAGYYEDKYFEQGDSSPAVAQVKDAAIGTPTCWDQWFPELAREYGLLKTDLLCYPTAIGTEPDHPNFDTEPMWRQMMVAHGIANGLFIAAVNRTGIEDGVTFYGSSFISDPYGRILVRAGQSDSTVLVADLDLDQKRDWLTLFPFFNTRRPSMYKNIAKT